MKGPRGGDRGCICFLKGRLGAVERLAWGCCVCCGGGGRWILAARIWVRIVCFCVRLSSTQAYARPFCSATSLTRLSRMKITMALNWHSNAMSDIDALEGEIGSQLRAGRINILGAILQ